MNDINRTARELYKIIKANEKDKGGYDAQATVKRVENGIAYVHFEGGVDETPARLTIDAKQGDLVQVRVVNGRAYLVGNASAPPTDNTQAKEALSQAGIAAKAAGIAREKAEDATESANIAYQAARTAQGSAEDAAEAAREAKGSADEAARIAGEAADSAGRAEASAATANTAANNALTQLSTVEDVVGVLNWISEHGTYKVSEDTETEPGKFYFTRSGAGTSADPYSYAIVVNPSGDPSAQGWYELDSIDEAVSSYVSSHLALTDAGLWVVKDNSGYKILLANDGMKVYDPSGSLVATYGEVIRLSSKKAQYIGGENAYIVFNPATGELNIGGARVTFEGNRTLSDVLESIDAAVTSVVTEYALGDDAATAPASGWSTASPVWTPGKYIWQRTGTTVNGTTTYSNVTCIQGARGDAGEDAVILRMDSSRGWVFKNSAVSTTLSAVIYKGSMIITDIDTLHSVFGAGAYIQWSWQRMGEDRYGVISSDDSRIIDGGFRFVLSPADVDTKVTFQCALII